MMMPDVLNRFIARSLPAAGLRRRAVGRILAFLDFRQRQIGHHALSAPPSMITLFDLAENVFHRFEEDALARHVLGLSYSS